MDFANLLPIFSVWSDLIRNLFQYQCLAPVARDWQVPHVLTTALLSNKVELYIQTLASLHLFLGMIIGNMRNIHSIGWILVDKMLKMGNLKKEFPRFGHLLLKHCSIAADFTCRGHLFPSWIRGKRGPAVPIYLKVLASSSGKL